MTWALPIAFVLLAPAAADAEPEDDDRIDELEERVEELERQNTELQKRQSADHKQINRIWGRLGGYVDTGFYFVTGTGSGIIRDTGNERFPELDDVPGQWVFMGDPLSTMINSRGDPASLEGSRALQFDVTGGDGRSGFLVNALNLHLNAGMGESLAIEGLVDFLPRTRDVSNPNGNALGDFVDIKLAQVRWLTPARRFDLDLHAGKIDSVIGREYRGQEAPDRMTVTPSLICRYTCGRSMGLAARSSFIDRSLDVNLALTNGGNTVETFGFHDEADSNRFKTASGRIAYEFPTSVHLQLGASGGFGAQDLQPSDNVYQWQYGADAWLKWRDVELTWEFVFFRAQGQTSAGGVACDLSSCIRSMGTYGLASYRVLNWLVPYARVDWREAVHRGGTQFAYVTNVLRVTPGINFPVHQHVVIKAEYNFNLELGRLETFSNDVFTSSLVGHF